MKRQLNIPGDLYTKFTTRKIEYIQKNPLKICPRYMNHFEIDVRPRDFRENAMHLLFQCELEWMLLHILYENLTAVVTRLLICLHELD